MVIVRSIVAATETDAERESRSVPVMTEAMMTETPMAETPMAETPMAETPMAETTVSETMMSEIMVTKRGESMAQQAVAIMMQSTQTQSYAERPRRVVVAPQPRNPRRAAIQTIERAVISIGNKPATTAAAPDTAPETTSVPIAAASTTIESDHRRTAIPTDTGRSTEAAPRRTATTRVRRAAEFRIHAATTAPLRRVIKNGDTPA